MRTLLIFLATLVLLLGAFAAGSLWWSRPLSGERLDPVRLASIAIAPPAEALSFARSETVGRLQLLLVTGYVDGRVWGVDLGRHLPLEGPDPIAAYARYGHAALARLAQDHAGELSVAAESLVLPFDPPAAHIGIGANYAEHAREARIEEQPFVFPKLVRPGAALATVPRGDARRLDYEAELGFVALEDLRPDSRPQTLGLVLGNDFTDRWSLVLNLRRGEMGTTGFVEGKSREGFAPIGPLLVIPQDLERFYRGIELSLYVNGRLRQRERAGAMLWGPQEMLQQIFRREGWNFRRYKATVPLLARPGLLPRGTIIFSGTPAGVIFKPHNLWNRALYLQPGDEVVMRSDSLGRLRNVVTD